jgi:hypothetical protein
VIISQKGVQHNLIYIFWSYILFFMIFRSFTHFLGFLSIHFWNFGKEKTFPACGPSFGPRPRLRGPAAHSALQAATSWPSPAVETNQAGPVA